MKRLIFLLILFAGCKTNNTTTISISFDNNDNDEVYVTRPLWKDGNYLVDTIAKANIVDQKATISLQLDEPYIARVSWPTQQQSLSVILEPGNINISPKEDGYTVQGGKYYNTIVNGINSDSAYMSVINSLDSLRKSAKDYNTLTLEEKDLRIKQYRKLYNAQSKAEEKYFTSLYEKATPIEQLLIISHRSYLFDLEKSEAEILRLEKELGAGYNITYLKESFAKEKQDRLNKLSVSAGKPVKDFTATDINGKEYKVSDVIKKNKLTLLEFWASWCGPCKGEIPYLKKDYQEFKNKGFEIFSYSIDEDKNSWIQASNEEQLPWINTCGFKGWKSPGAELYFVQGVPSNFLIDQNGTIVATDLRRLDLMNKLKELLK